jgi:hypothetical protein
LQDHSTKTKNFVPDSGKLVGRKFSLVGTRLNEVAGFMRHLPNLLKQESSSAATLVHVLLRMYHDTRSEHQAARPQIAERLVP